MSTTSKPPPHVDDDACERAVRQAAGYAIQATVAIERLEATIKSEFRRTRNAIGFQVFLAMLAYALLLGGSIALLSHQFVPN